MTIQELMQPISELPHSEKLRLVRLLLEQLACEEAIDFHELESKTGKFDSRAYFGAGRRSEEEIESHLAEVREGWKE